MDTGLVEVIDFDQWATLARTDPAAFEARRAERIEALLRNAPPARQERLRRLQWRIDQIRRTSATPLAACIRISGMMWASVCGPCGMVQALNGRGGGAPAAPAAVARVLAFRPDSGKRSGPPSRDG
jgi:hypothetical protein